MAVGTSDNSTFEEVDQYIQSADLSVFQAGGQNMRAAAIPNVCKAYSGSRQQLSVPLANVGNCGQRFGYDRRNGQRLAQCSNQQG